MAAVTLLEAAKHHQDTLERTVTKIIVENSPILQDLPMKSITGNAYRYNRESFLGLISFRGVGGTYTPSSGIINPQMEGLTIMGGEVELDRFEIKTSSNLISLKAEKFQMKARAAGIKFSETFFEGDSAVDPYSFDGIRKRLVGSQHIYIGADGAVNGTNGGGQLTLGFLDRLLARVVGPNSQKRLYMNRDMSLYVTHLQRIQTGSSQVSTTRDAFGNQTEAYAGAQIMIVEREDDGSTILGFDEYDAGSSGNLDTCSIYCCRFGEQYLHGIQNGGMPGVDDFGELQGRPAEMGRLEWYVGLVAKHPRCMARLSRVNTPVF